MDISNEGAIVVWVVMIIISLIGALIRAMVVSGIFHVISLVSKIERLRFNKVFPFVLIVSIIVYAIQFFFGFGVFVNW